MKAKINKFLISFVKDKDSAVENGFW